VTPQIATVVGARPQFVKAAVVSKALRVAGGVREYLIHTGQHYDVNLSDIFFDELGLQPPDVNLAVGSGTHAAQTAAMLLGLEQVLLECRPRLVVIYGDTNSTLAAALAAAKLNIPIAHVEAGLRSFDRSMPEEINRIVADRLARLLFAPTEGALQQLRDEGLPPEHCHLVGDVMFDSLLRLREKARARSGLVASRAREGGYLLATIHRAANTDDPVCLRAILAALSELAADLPVLFPIHPRTRSRLEQLEPPWQPAPRIELLDPVGYLDMLALEAGAKLILTDSGGVQKEAFFNRVPCVTVRTETEWRELIDAGWNRLAPPESASSIVAVVREALAAPLPPIRELYGGGEAGARIAEILRRFVGLS
jgi:UDP-GlcNAc3NAcA epimerase